MRLGVCVPMNAVHTREYAYVARVWICYEYGPCVRAAATCGRNLVRMWCRLYSPRASYLVYIERRYVVSIGFYVIYILLGFGVNPQCYRCMRMRAHELRIFNAWCNALAR